METAVSLRAELRTEPGAEASHHKRLGIAQHDAEYALFAGIYCLDRFLIAPFEECRAVTTKNRMLGRSARWKAASLGLSLRASLRASLGVSALLSLAPGHVAAQGKLEAQYEATLAGIPVGRGAWNIDINEDSYGAAAVGGTTGLLKTIANGSGTGEAQGRVISGALVPFAYKASTTTSKKHEAIHINLANGNVKDFGIVPEPPVDADRVPVTDAHKKGVLDPMTASLLRVPGTGEVLSPEACRAGAAVFDGRMRYDLKLDFKRMETVKAEKGYHGPVVVCAIYFTPISGYIPDRPVIRYLSGQRNIEIAFAPILGTRVLVPFRMKIPTPLGTAMLEATQFLTKAVPPHVAKTQ